jgi:hypothetical protein
MTGHNFFICYSIADLKTVTIIKLSNQTTASTHSFYFFLQHNERIPFFLLLPTHTTLVKISKHMICRDSSYACDDLQQRNGAQVLVSKMQQTFLEQIEHASTFEKRPRHHQDL